MPTYAKRIKRNPITGKLFVEDAPLRKKKACAICGEAMLVAPGQIAKYHGACRKLRHNKSLR